MTGSATRQNRALHSAVAFKWAVKCLAHMTCHGRIPEVRSQFMSGFIGWLLVAAAEDVQVMIQQVC